MPMRCSEIQNKFDDYLDGEIPTEMAWSLKRHVSDCTTCQSELDERRALRQCLSELPVPAPSEDFFDRAFDGLDDPATELTTRTTGRRRTDHATGWPKSRRMAIAAVFAAVCAMAFIVQQPFVGTPSAEIPEVTIALHEVTPVRLAFSAPVALKDARLSLQLPEGVELAGYSGRSQLSWKTDLEPGKNVLRLPLVGHVAAADEVVATLEHARGTKTFRLKIKVI
jgi:anti-sigma factor RsiW